MLNNPDGTGPPRVITVHHNWRLDGDWGGQAGVHWDVQHDVHTCLNVVG